MTVKLKLTPQRNALLKGFDNEFYALLQLIDENNNSENTTKKNLNLSIVLDKSGSMSGQPFDEAKKAAVMIIEKLRPSDIISVVAYDDQVDLVVPSSLKETCPTLNGSPGLRFSSFAASSGEAVLDISLSLYLYAICYFYFFY